MRATRLRDLVLFAVAAGVLAWVLVRHLYGDLPRFNWFVPVALPVLAIAEAVFGWQLRLRIQRRRGARLLDPLAAARAVALAKASAIVGAVMAGAWLGLLVYTVPQRDNLSAAHGDTIVGIVGAVGAVALVLAALWLEFCCRTPDEDRQQREGAARTDADRH